MSFVFSVWYIVLILAVLGIGALVAVYFVMNKKDTQLIQDFVSSSSEPVQEQKVETQDKPIEEAKVEVAPVAEPVVEQEKEEPKE